MSSRLIGIRAPTGQCDHDCALVSSSAKISRSQPNNFFDHDAFAISGSLHCSPTGLISVIDCHLVHATVMLRHATSTVLGPNA